MQASPARRPLLPFFVLGCCIVGVGLVLCLRWWVQPESLPETDNLKLPPASSSAQHGVRPSPESPPLSSWPQVAVTPPKATVAVPPPGAPLQKTAADTLRFAVVTAKGDSGALRVYPGRNRVAFAQLGLRPGDQIIAVNGAGTAGHTWEALLASLPDDGRLVITVERAGRLLQLDAQTLPPRG